jgi:hypothetical protein
MSDPRENSVRQWSKAFFLWVDSVQRSLIHRVRACCPCAKFFRASLISPRVSLLEEESICSLTRNLWQRYVWVASYASSRAGLHSIGGIHDRYTYRILEIWIFWYATSQKLWCVYRHTEWHCRYQQDLFPRAALELRHDAWNEARGY